jgi:hypothetical protein
MSENRSKSLSASIKQRLLNLSRQSRIEFNTLLTEFALERFLYRMSVWRGRTHFVLKGALLFRIWSKELHRTTRDADVLVQPKTSLDRLTADFRNICKVKVEPDGIRFLSESVRAQEIRAQNVFGGVRITLKGIIGKARVPLQIDVGFGDVCVPPAKVVRFPALLDFPSPRLKAYARETMIAEKFLAIVVLGMRNSRMKDYFDIFFLSREFSFKGNDLVAALRATFERQRISIPGRVPLGLSAEFAADRDKRTQWRRFLIQTNAMDIENEFTKALEFIRKFLMPAAEAASKSTLFKKNWRPGGPWKESTYP